MKEKTYRKSWILKKGKGLWFSVFDRQFFIKERIKKNGINDLVKGKLIAGVYCRVFHRIGNNFLDGIGHWMSRIRQSSFTINFLKQKYVHTPMLTRAQLPYLIYSVFTAVVVK